ncbi:siderophore-interacting protein [Chloroflexia bacterium SDU3-3]|nr:siderophore-interacting protein [Chloroflexia bacterium SDU3-3]
MTIPTQTPATRPGPRLLTVRRSQHITPHMQRVTLGGEALAGFPTGREGANIKIFLPQPGQAAPTLPSFGQGGITWPADAPRAIVRTYTLRSYRADAGEIDIDFVLHDHAGPASAWAASAKPGDTLGVGGPGAGGPVLPPAEWHLLVGDLSALPAIGALLENMPATARGHALVELASPEDRQQLAVPPGVTLAWLDQPTPGQPSPLVAAVRALAWPTAAQTFTWLAGENSAVIQIRDELRQAHGLDRSQLRAVPYWKRGTAEEAYHDERHTVMDG